MVVTNTVTASAVGAAILLLNEVSRKFLFCLCSISTYVNTVKKASTVLVFLKIV